MIIKSDVEKPQVVTGTCVISKSIPVLAGILSTRYLHTGDSYIQVFPRINPQVPVQVLVLMLSPIPVPCMKDVGTFYNADTPSTVPHLSHIQIQTLFQLTPHPPAGPCPPAGPHPLVWASIPLNHSLEWTGSGGNIEEGSMFLPSSMFPIHPVSTNRKSCPSCRHICPQAAQLLCYQIIDSGII